MVCTANDLLGWSDFPKGLRVLLLDEDTDSSAKIKSRLEKMDYIVATFCNEDEALAVISSRSESFHVAIVEVTTENSLRRFKFLEAAKDLPTIMISDIQCLSTMMKCIALGAVEFLIKPLSDEKLKNIWQHVVHKAFNAGEKDLTESLKPDKESVFSMLSFQSKEVEKIGNLSVKTEKIEPEHSTGSDKYPAPPTPQLKQVVRLIDDGDCQDQTNCSTEKESGDQYGESKFADTTTISCNIVDENTTTNANPPMSVEETILKDDDHRGGPDSYKSESNLLTQPNFKSGHERSNVHNSCGKKADRKKMKVDWTPELHKKFVQAVEKLGVDQAIPSRILEFMKVEGLTRHNIASHLQKYRMQRRHILPKEDDKRWPLRRDLSQKIYYPQRPLVAYPPYHNTNQPNGPPAYPSWGPHGSYPSMWGLPFYPQWQPTPSWHWKPYPEMQADAWGCPVMPPPHGHCQPSPQHANGFHNANAVNGSYSVPQNSFDLYPAEEVIDKVVKEAISKPWLPLPIGLKPPSTDSVLTELSKQGISTIPPHHIINDIRHC